MRRPLPLLLLLPACSLLDFSGIEARPSDDAATDAMPMDAAVTDAPDAGDVVDAGNEASSSDIPVKLGLVLWARARAQEVVVTDGGVETWRDESPNHADLVQSTVAQRPSWIANAVRVTAGTGFSLSKDVFVSSATTGYSVFVVCAVASNGTWLFATNAQANLFSIEHADTGVVVRIAASSVGPFPIIEKNKRHAYGVILDGSRVSVSRDGVELGVGDGGGVPPPVSRDQRSFAAMELNGGLVSSAIGDYLEVAIYERPVTPAEQAMLQTYFQATWGL